MATLIFHEPSDISYSIVAGTSMADGTWTFRDGAGALLDLSGFTAIQCELRTAYESPTVEVLLSTADGSLVNGGALGTITVEHDIAATKAIMVASGHKPVALVGDWEAIHANGVDAIFRTKVLVKPSSTRTGD